MASYNSVYNHWGDQDPDTIGIAFLLTNGDEDDKQHLPGTLPDRDHWNKVLKELKFDVRSDHNVREDRMKQYLKAVAKVKLHSECKFVVFVFSGHGVEGALCSFDHKEICLADYLPNFFSDKLSKINKLFFFDACREGNDGKYLTLHEALFKSKPKESTGGYLAFCAVPLGTEADDDPDGSRFSTIVPKLISEDYSLSDVIDMAREELTEMTYLDRLSGGLSPKTINLWQLAKSIECPEGKVTTVINDPSLPEVLRLKPSDAGLQGVIQLVGMWNEVAIAVGVPQRIIEGKKLNSNPALNSLLYWRNGNTPNPVSWEFLLKKIGEHESLGDDMAETIKQKVVSQEYRDWTK